LTNVAILARLIRAGWTGMATVHMRQLCFGAIAMAIFVICIAFFSMGRTWSPEISNETHFSGYCHIAVVLLLLCVLIATSQDPRLSENSRLAERLNADHSIGEIITVSTMQLPAYWLAGFVVDFFSPTPAMFQVILLATLFYEFAVALMVAKNGRLGNFRIGFVRWGFPVCVWIVFVLSSLFLPSLNR
jgi:hypothetical protein